VNDCTDTSDEYDCSKSCFDTNVFCLVHTLSSFIVVNLTLGVNYYRNNDYISLAILKATFGLGSH